MARLAKTSMPSVSRAVARERLFARLDGSDDSQRPIVWICGPPGAGKTLLIATYVEARKLGCTWYHVDAGDADLASFVFYLAGAAGGGGHGRKDAPPLFTPEYKGSEAAFARRFFRNLAVPKGRPFVFVFDDVSEVSRDAAMHLVLREGLAELPPRGRAIVVSREEPPPAYARLVASGALTVIGGDELRLSADEALALAAAHSPRGTPRASLERVCAAADGWAAGLVLLASAGRAPETAAPSSAAIFDYLANEVFDHASGDVREVLLNAALVATVPARLADRLCASDRGETVLSDLARRAYFTTCNEEPDRSFQLHPLFRAFLLSRALAARSPEELRQDRARAAGILAAEGYADQAMSLFVEAHAWSEVARLALAEAPALVATGRAATLERWLLSIPVELREQQPWLSYWLGRCRVPYDPREARRLLAAAYRGFEAVEDARGLYAASITAIEVVLLEWADFRDMDPWIERLNELQARGIAVPSRRLELRLTVAMFGAMTFHHNGSPALLPWEQRAVEAVRDASTPLPLRLLVGSWFVLESAIRGEIARSRPIVDLLAPLAHSRETDPLSAIGWLASEAVHCWHSGEPARGTDAVVRGLQLAADSGVHLWDFLLRLQGVNVALAEDDVDRARSHLAAAATSLKAMQPLNIGMLEHARGLIALRVGDVAAAAESARAVVALGRDGAMPFLAVIGSMMLALATTRVDDARPHLESACRLGAEIHSSLAEFLCDLCRADLARRSGDLASAREHLRRAFALAREKGVVPDAWFSRPQLAQLSAVALEGGIEVEHVRALVRRLRLERPAGTLELEAWPSPAQVRLLGPFEARTGDEPLRFRANAQRRPLDLLAAIVGISGRSAPVHAVEDALWPDSDGAHHALESALHRLRRLLGVDVVRHAERTLSIEPRRCWVDSVAFEALLARAEAQVERRDVAGALDATARAVQLYRGPFLADRDEPWILRARTRLRRRLQRALAALAHRGASTAELDDLRGRVAAADPAVDAAAAARLT